MNMWESQLVELRPGKPALAPAVAVPTVAAAGKRGMRLRPYNTRHGLLRQPDPLPQAQAPVRGERLSHAPAAGIISGPASRALCKICSRRRVCFFAAALRLSKNQREGQSPFALQSVPGGVYGGGGGDFLRRKIPFSRAKIASLQFPRPEIHRISAETGGGRTKAAACGGNRP